MFRMQASLAAAALVLVGAARRSAGAATATSPGRTVASPVASTDACSLLSAADVSKAIEAKSLPGEPLGDSNVNSCIWSDDPNHSLDSRRVTLSMNSSVARFESVKSRGGHIAIVPLSGVGDDAYYEIVDPVAILQVRKASVVMTIRVLNGSKLAPFTVEQEKAKEAELGRAAVGRL